MTTPLQADGLYPMTNAVGVPDNASVFVFEQFFGSTQVPVAVAAANQSPVPLQATAVPSPLPSPYTQPTIGATIYAAALPSLSPETNYTVYEYEGGFAGGNGICSEPAGYAGVVGSFTTQ